MNSRLLYQKKHEAVREFNRNSQPAAVINNKLEALKVLANSMLAEVTSLERNKEVAAQSKIDLNEEVERFEIDLIRCALMRTGGRQRQAARLLNIKPTTLHAKLKRYKILQMHVTDSDDASGEEAEEISIKKIAA